MYSFDGMDIPMRHSPRDPGLPVPLQIQRPVFRPPEPRPFTPDIPDSDNSDRSGSGTADAFFNHDILDGLDIPDAPYFHHRFSRRMDLADEISASSNIERRDSSSLPLLVENSSPVDDLISSSPSNNASSNASSPAMKMTRDLPSGGDLLSAAASLLPMLNLGPFQPLTKAFQAEPVEDREVGGVRRGNPYRRRMKNMFVGLRRFVTKE